ncbi:MAG TPA: hypothetical protein VJ909_01435 [Prolixibacteraceae bacterium]|nr:hypothetical protein [Prolixibacteraceae bacterium]
MSLKDTLRKQNYDLIHGPVRNQDLLQVWIKRDFDQINFYRKSMIKIFEEEFNEEPFINDALAVVSSDTESFDFSSGMRFLKNALLQFEFSDASIEEHIKNGKSVSVSYDNSYTKEYASGAIEAYLSGASFDNENTSLQKQLNRDNLIVIAGVVFAGNLHVKIETETDINTEVEASLSRIGIANVKFEKTSDRQITMNATGDKAFPVAVKAYRMRFRNDKFAGLRLVTDNRNFF